MGYDLSLYFDNGAPEHHRRVLLVEPSHTRPVEAAGIYSYNRPS